MQPSLPLVLALPDSSHQGLQMDFPEIGIAGSCQEVPDVSSWVQKQHQLEVDEGRLGLVLGEQDVVDPVHVPYSFGHHFVY